MACPFFLATVRMPVYKFSSRSLSVNYLVSAPLFFRHPTDFSSCFFFFYTSSPSPHSSLYLCLLYLQRREQETDGATESRRTAATAGGGRQQDVQTPTASSAHGHTSHRRCLKGQSQPFTTNYTPFILL